MVCAFQVLHRFCFDVFSGVLPLELLVRSVVSAAPIPSQSLCSRRDRLRWAKCLLARKRRDERGALRPLTGSRAGFKHGVRFCRSPLLRPRTVRAELAIWLHDARRRPRSARDPCFPCGSAGIGGHTLFEHCLARARISATEDSSGQSPLHKPQNLDLHSSSGQMARQAVSLAPGHI